MAENPPRPYPILGSPSKAIYGRIVQSLGYVTLEIFRNNEMLWTIAVKGNPLSPLKDSRLGGHVY